MRKIIRKVECVALCLIMVLVLTNEALAYIPPGVTSGNLYASYVTQAKSLWCWVACAENATIQEGCNLYDQYFAVYVLKGQTPDFYPNVTGTISETEAAAELLCGNTRNYFGVDYTKTYSFLCEQIYHYHSVIAGYTYQYNGGVYGHMILLMGWNTSSGTQWLRYHDPGDGNYHCITYASFCNGTDGIVYSATCYVI